MGKRGGGVWVGVKKVDAIGWVLVWVGDKGRVGVVLAQKGQFPLPIQPPYFAFFLIPRPRDRVKPTTTL